MNWRPFGWILLYIVFALASPAAALEYNTDRPGLDYRSFDLPSPDPILCQNACDQESNCKAFTYVNPGVQGMQARCWLKSSVPNPVPNQPCCISGLKAAPSQLQARELIANGQFTGLQGWTVHEWYRPSDGKGEVILEADGVKFKSTSGNNRIGVMQALNVDVSGAQFLVLTVRLKASQQALDGTGWQGREAPVAVFAAYTDVNGVVHNGIPSMANPSEPQGSRMFWEGVYFADPTGNSRNWHGTKVPKDQFYTFQYDLMTLNPKPRTIQFVGAEGAGWSPREGEIASLSLSLVAETPQPVAIDLTGAWNGNDGGKYYIRQLGNNVWWYGEAAPTSPAWSNVAHGDLAGNELRLEWADVPKGRNMFSGNLVLKVESNSRMVAISKTGGFGGSVWSR